MKSTIQVELSRNYLKQSSDIDIRIEVPNYLLTSLPQWQQDNLARYVAAQTGGNVAGKLRRIADFIAMMEGEDHFQEHQATGENLGRRALDLRPDEGEETY